MHQGRFPDDLQQADDQAPTHALARRLCVARYMKPVQGAPLFASPLRRSIPWSSFALKLWLFSKYTPWRDAVLRTYYGKISHSRVERWPWCHKGAVIMSLEVSLGNLHVNPGHQSRQSLLCCISRTKEEIRQLYPDRTGL